jgi:hypothetical protein
MAGTENEKTRGTRGYMVAQKVHKVNQNCTHSGHYEACSSNRFGAGNRDGARLPAATHESGGVPDPGYLTERQLRRYFN